MFHFLILELIHSTLVHLFLFLLFHFIYLFIFFIFISILPSSLFSFIIIHHRQHSLNRCPFIHSHSHTRELCLSSLFGGGRSEFSIETSVNMIDTLFKSVLSFCFPLSIFLLIFLFFFFPFLFIRCAL